MRFPRLLLALIALTCTAVRAAQATSVCQVGVPDNFSAGGSEIVTPTLAWDGCMANTTGGTRGGLDVCLIDHYTAHSFLLGSCAAVDQDTAGTGAILITVRVRGVGGQTGNDYLLLAAGGSALWGTTLSTLQCLRTGGADCVWSGGDTATFTLNMAALPPSTTSPFICDWPAGVTSVAAMVEQAAELDVAVTDDSCVDYFAVRFDAAVPVRRGSWGVMKVLYR